MLNTVRMWLPADELESMIECGICKDAMKDPRTLPCVHSFCLNCLEQCVVETRTGTLMPCPICRQKFRIPKEGFYKLIVNFVINKMILFHAASLQRNIKFEKLQKYFCDNHQKNLIEFYCYDCEVTFCSICFLPDHYKHNCETIEEILRTLKKHLEDESDAINGLRHEITGRLQNYSEQKTFFVRNVEEVKMAVKLKGEEMKEVVDWNIRPTLDQQVHCLLTKLDSSQSRIMEALNVDEKDLRRKERIMQYFILFCERLVATSDHVRITGVMKLMQARAAELRSQNMTLLKPPNVEFLRSSSVDGITPASIGKIAVTHSVRPSLSGMAISKDKIYLVFNISSQVEVRDVHTFAHQKNIDLIGLKKPHDIVSNQIYAYISDAGSCSIVKLLLLDETQSRWSAHDSSCRLSITSAGNVVTSSTKNSKIVEYTSDGEKIREIVLVDVVRGIGLQHAVSFENEGYLVCLVHQKLSRVGVVNLKGRVVKCHGWVSGPDVGHLDVPIHLSVDGSGLILVADQNNNRIVQLAASPLTFVQEVIPASHGLVRPTRLCLQEDTGLLYVAGKDGNIHVFTM